MFWTKQREGLDILKTSAARGTRVVVLLVTARLPATDGGAVAMAVIAAVAKARKYCPVHIVKAVVF